MGKRIQQGRGYWEKELRYIQGVDPLNNTVFRRDPLIFKRYVVMQARFAKEDGYPAISFEMLKTVKGII